VKQRSIPDAYRSPSAERTWSEGPGRARCRTIDAATSLWRLPLHDDPVGDRLLSFGEANLGGFVDGGIDDEGVWLVRRLGAASLTEVLREQKGPWPWRDAIAIAIGIARALAAAERAALFPGPLSPDAAVLHEAGKPASVVLRAEALVLALVGADASAARSSESVAPLWTPPEQASGAVWDGAGNRYALGLLAYRLLAGAHPFGGAGLRHALAEAARREPPPFADEIAATLPPGLQSLVLRMLHPSVHRRPPSAEAIAKELTSYVEGTASRSAAPALANPERLRYIPRSPEPPPSASAPSAAPRPRPRPPNHATRARSLWPIGAGAMIAFGALFVAMSASKSEPAP
jgi:eukaryotic-like serine/threonine-protein kinase